MSRHQAYRNYDYEQDLDEYEGIDEDEEEELSPEDRGMHPNWLDLSWKYATPILIYISSPNGGWHRRNPRCLGRPGFQGIDPTNTRSTLALLLRCRQIDLLPDEQVYHATAPKERR